MRPIRALLLLSLGCGSTESVPDGPVEDLPTLPEVTADPNVVRFELEEQIVPAHQDIVLCHFLESTTEEMFATAFESHQGKHGHHLIMFKARFEEAPGTIRDCTTPEDMVKFTPVISSTQFGLEHFPEGMAIRVPARSQIVLQQHYVNTSDRDLIVRDVALLRTLPKEQVTTLAGFFGLSDIFFELPPRQESTVAFDCTVPRDMNVLLVGPHMHEWGRKFKASLRGSVARSLIDLDWRSEYRDFPVVTTYDVDAPLTVRAGDVLSTSCLFDNTTDAPLRFPEEMCATYGYFFPAVSGQDEFLCAGGDS